MQHLGSYLNVPFHIAQECICVACVMISKYVFLYIVTFTTYSYSVKPQL